MNCSAISHMIKGGKYPCLREAGHLGVHMGESGDRADHGFYLDFEIVDDVKDAIWTAQRRTGIKL